MNLGMLKELEDLKAELNELVGRNSKQILRRKTQFLDDAAKAFEDFFKNQGFSVTQFNRIYSAKYGNMDVEMKLPSPNDTFLGCYSNIDLDLKGFRFGKAKYEIRLNEHGKYPKFTSKMVPANRSEEDKTKEEIESLKEKIAETGSSIEQFDQTKWAYGLVSTDANNSGRSNAYPQFSTMRELLESIFQ